MTVDATSSVPKPRVRGDYGRFSEHTAAAEPVMKGLNSVLIQRQL